MARIQSLFATHVYSAPLGRRALALNRELLQATEKLQAVDAAGRRWSQSNYPGGFTTYGSLDKLHVMSSVFGDLQRQLDRHVRGYAKTLQWDLRGQKLVMTDCWVNVMPQGCAHSFHLHPQSLISGTYYVRVPRGAPGLKFEDPRLSKFMAAPQRPGMHRTHPAKAGEVVLFESWLRHEVPANLVAAERVSVSFNYHLAA